MTGTGKRIVWIVMLMLVILWGLAACGGNQNDPSESTEGTSAPVTASPTPTPSPTLTPTPTPDLHEGEKRSYLTGEWIPEEEAEQRPYAVILNNLKTASPQSGIGEADILYEALTEGGITRFLGIYEDIGTDRLGSVRSARHYFVTFADEYDAIFIHFGKTSYATRKMNELGIDHVDGTGGSGASTFYRDSSIPAPHNAFTGLEQIEETVQRLGFRTSYEEDFEGHFLFREEAGQTDEKEGAVTADKVTLGFSGYISPYFEYSSEDSLYYRFQFGEAHIDYNTKEQLAFRNLIIQFVREWDIDQNGYQTMELEDASGEGYYITDGILVPITWEKAGTAGITRYYDTDGKEIELNPGKTYIAVFPDSRMDKAVIE